MPVERLKEFLDDHHIKYVNITHSPAYTAQEIAASAHVPGKDLAKTVICKVDDEMIMAVVRAPDQIDLDLLRGAAGGTEIALATEQEFRDRFPDCEPGAMPPFGNLYNMALYVEEGLTKDDEIVFNAGSHKELLRLKYADFARLTSPKVANFAQEQ